MSETTTPLDAAALTAFTATLSNLPREEIQKAKRLYILNAIADFKAQCASGRAMMITFGVLSIIPIFLIVTIPAYIGYRNGVAAGRQKILNALEVWKDDLGSHYAELRAGLEA